MVKLILKLKETQNEEFALEKAQINIGRDKENDVVIDNIAVSGKHALIRRKEGKGYFIRDLNSSNGTFLNGTQIDTQDHPLTDGAVIGIAKFEIRVKEISPQAPSPAQEHVEAKMIFEAAQRKPATDPPVPAEPKPIRWPVLSATKGPDKGKEYKITKEVTLLGKDPENDIPAEGWFVSSPQAKIFRRGERFYISHLGGFLSATKVNGIGIKDDHILKNKDQLEIGNSGFVFTQAPAEHTD
ncbi:MAG: FHA domain-containing protein [Syntrophaceae bacterium]|nr:FHA domain-containing protein [Syntrophaceae bacterium]